MPQFERVISSHELPRGITARLAGDVAPDQRRQLRRLGLNIREVGATAISIAPAGRRRSGTAALAGVVYDSIFESPLADAIVYVTGTAHEAGTDTAGRDQLLALPAGEWTVAFHHPTLDLLGFAPDPLRIRLAPGDTLRLDLATPSAASVLGGRCAAGEEWVVGFVRSGADGHPLPGVRVVAEWDEEWRRIGERGFAAERVERRGAVTDAAGAYAICGVRPGARVRVRAELDVEHVRRTEIPVRAGGGGRADFTFDPCLSPLP